MKTPLIAVLVLLPVVSTFAGRVSGSREGPNGGSVQAEGVQAGRFSAGQVTAEGANGGTAEAQGARAGRFGAGSVNAQGANGGTYDASAARAGRFGAAQSSAQGPNGNTVDRSAAGYNGTAVNGAATSTTYNNNTTVNRAAASNGNTTVYQSNTTYNGYRSGYVYTNGSYQTANVAVNTVYVAPVGAYAGWQITTQPDYVVYPAYATYPVEVAVQAELKVQGYYAGDVDGNVGPMTQKAIANYQAANGLPPTGQINKALLKSLNIS